MNVDITPDEKMRREFWMSVYLACPIQNEHIAATAADAALNKYDQRFKPIHEEYGSDHPLYSQPIDEDT